MRLTQRKNTIEENLQAWDRVHPWQEEGDEWSASWGSAQFQWTVSILPRIQRFLPAKTILEIAPGHGRWTQFLLSQCERLIAVDLSPTCIESCKRRFANNSRLELHKNDGMSLAMIPDESVDFAFSFDSLVHAEAGVLLQYVKQLGRKLRPGGAGFLHHSNAAGYRSLLGIGALLRKMPVLRMANPYIERHWRAMDTTARLMLGFCEQSGLRCVSQELVPWGKTLLPIDCLTTFERPLEAETKPPRVVTNLYFMREAKAARRLSDLYRLE